MKTKEQMEYDRHEASRLENERKYEKQSIIFAVVIYSMMFGAAAYAVIPKLLERLP